MLKILCIIPARGGSKGVPRKNIRPLNGKPLIAYSIEAALNSGVVEKLVVSTEDDEIAEVAKKFGAEVVKRPIELAEDTTLTEPVMIHALETVEKEGYKPDFVSLIQCTSPFLTSQVIQEAVEKVTEHGFDSCITVFSPDGYEFKWKKHESGRFIPEHDPENRPRRQNLVLPYHENGAFYITKAELFRKTKNRFGGNIARVIAVEMSERDSLQVDSLWNFELAEYMMKKKNAHT